MPIILIFIKLPLTVDSRLRLVVDTRQRVVVACKGCTSAAEGREPQGATPLHAAAGQQWFVQS